MSYGTDIKGVEDVDFNLTFLKESEQELGYVQSIARRYITPRGGLFYALHYGLDIRQFLVDSTPPEIAAGIIAAEARKDERTLRSTCTIKVNDDGTWEPDLFVEGSEEDEYALTFLVTSASVELLKVS